MGVIPMRGLDVIEHEQVDVYVCLSHCAVAASTATVTSILQDDYSSSNRPRSTTQV